MKQWTFLGLALLAACDDRGTTVTIKGSDTMVILGQRWAETYMSGHPGVTVQVTGGGSGTGIAALINGSTDICQASRPMKEKERAETKQKRGKDVIEFEVALDGIAVYVHESNPFQEITLEQLRDIYLGKITSWEPLGGKGPIVVYGRDNSSGTYEYFKEHVLDKADFYEKVQTLPGTANVVNAVSKEAQAIGYGGIAYSKGVRAIRVRGKDGAFEPTIENVVSGKYPISRRLYFYTAGQPEGDVKAFIDWVRSAEGQAVVKQVGYYPLPK